MQDSAQQSGVPQTSKWNKFVAQTPPSLLLHPAVKNLPVGDGNMHRSGNSFRPGSSRTPSYASAFSGRPTLRGGPSPAKGSAKPPIANLNLSDPKFKADLKAYKASVVLEGPRPGSAFIDRKLVSQETAVPAREGKPVSTINAPPAMPAPSATRTVQRAVQSVDPTHPRSEPRRSTTGNEDERNNIPQIPGIPRIESEVTPAVAAESDVEGVVRRIDCQPRVLAAPSETQRSKEEVDSPSKATTSASRPATGGTTQLSGASTAPASVGDHKATTQTDQNASSAAAEPVVSRKDSSIFTCDETEEFVSFDSDAGPDPSTAGGLDSSEASEVADAIER
ncbi:hypothetical protein HKX48_003478 [Thoreauomyces humboldtii]|nr:hypothetical protein HKX48_003478 [Thoreauomyces humboldtii]